MGTWSNTVYVLDCQWLQVYAHDKMENCVSRAINLSKQYPSVVFKVQGYSRHSKATAYVNGLVAEISDERILEIMAEQQANPRYIVSSWYASYYWFTKDGKLEIAWEKEENENCDTYPGVTCLVKSRRAGSTKIWRITDQATGAVEYWRNKVKIDEEFVNQIAIAYRKQYRRENAFIVPKHHATEFDLIGNAVQETDFSGIAEVIRRLQKDLARVTEINGEHGLVLDEPIKFLGQAIVYIQDHGVKK